MNQNAWKYAVTDMNAMTSYTYCRNVFKQDTSSQIDDFTIK